MIIDWTHAGPTAMAAFLAATVEFIEALTIVLAVGTVRGWRATLFGAGAGMAVLLLVVAALGPTLAAVPLAALQALVGTLLVLFGMRWLHKAILRGAQVIAKHDEALIYAQQEQALRQTPVRRNGWDGLAFTIAFKSVLLEGSEVVFIVIALAAGDAGLWWPASVGALAALIVVGLLGLAVRRPLARVPENALKFVVGVLLSAFGTFWVGEGAGLAWPGHEWAVVGLIAGYFIVASIALTLCKQQATRIARGRRA